MALVEFVPENQIACVGCGKRIPVGTLAYRDDEMEGSFWCKRCYDETVAEIMAEGEGGDFLFDEDYDEEPAVVAAEPPEPVAAPVAAVSLRSAVSDISSAAPAASLPPPIEAASAAPAPPSVGPAPAVPLRSSAGFASAASSHASVSSAPEASLHSSAGFAPAAPPRPLAGPAPAMPPRPLAGPAPAMPPRPSAGPAPAVPPRPSAGPAPAVPPRPSAGPAPAVPPRPSAGPAPVAPSHQPAGPTSAAVSLHKSVEPEPAAPSNSTFAPSGVDSLSSDYPAPAEPILSAEEPNEDNDHTYRIGRHRVSEETLASYPPLGVEPVSLNSEPEPETEDQNEVDPFSDNVFAPSTPSYGKRKSYTETAAVSAMESVPGSMSEIQRLWNRYHNYMADNLSADMVEGLADIGSRNWTCISSDMETVISQGNPSLKLGPEAEQILARLAPGQSLEYGWPLVAVETNEGMSVAPLLVVTISQPPYENNSALVLSEPIINPAVLRAIWSHSSDVNFLRSSFGDGVPQGAVAISRHVQQICETMGLTTYNLDPLKLVRQLPTDPGVYNMAVLMITNPNSVAQRSIEELREIAKVSDWEDSSIACLFGYKLKDVGEHQTMPVMPWSAESVFEDSLQLIRTKSLTVFTMSQRDIIDQLIASACANAWIDNESILVLSDDDKRLDEIVNLAGDVHSGMLVRTCVAQDLISNPKRKCSSLSDLAETLINEVQAASSSIRQIIGKAYKDLEKVEEIRKEALKGAAHRKTWSDKKIRWESKRLEIAKRIWQHGLYPQGTDPKVIGVQAKELEKAWMLKGVRSSMFLKQIGAKAGANIQDVVEWANISLHIKNAEAEISKVNDPDKYNVGSANYRWAASCIGAVSARVSGALTGCANILERLAECTERDEDTKSIVTELVPHLKAWASNYYDANQFFELQSCMFDTLILDNANQINLAWALPWAYRAKRLVIIGNPNGVPPNVFVDGSQLGMAAANYGFERQDLIDRGIEYGSASVFSAFSMA